MIKTFRHKGLEQFYLTGRKSGIQAAHASKLRLILTALDAAKSAKEMNLAGLRLHQLTGRLDEHYSVWVNGNWRVTFRFVGLYAELIDYLDYH